jgi:DNA-binding GntR family transcriptional regulator
LEFFKWWRLQSQSLNKFLGSMWDSFGEGTEQYYELIRLHQQIFQHIKDKKSDEAVRAMQRHFAIVLFQLLGSLY